MHGPDQRLAAAAALLLFAALALFGARYHWVEEAGTAERDGYVAQAESLLAGHLPRDPYRPLLYPLAVAGLARATGLAPFTAARLLANLAAAALAWLAWATGRRLARREGFRAGLQSISRRGFRRATSATGAGPRAGWWAMALTAANPNLWRIGQHVTTDMPFAALAAAALLAGLAYMARPRAATAAAGGLVLGLAAFTRGNAVFLLPALLAAWWLGWRRPRAVPATGGVLAPPAAPRSLGHLAAGAGAALAALLPHWALRAAAFGDPFHDENWKNLAWKLYGYPDWSYLERVPFTGWLDVLRVDPARVARGAATEMARFAVEGLPQLFGTWLHVLLIVAGAVVALRQPTTRRAAAWLLAAGGLFVVATAVVFFTWGRLLLFLLPLGNGLAGALLNAPPLARRRRLATVFVGALVALLALKTFAFRLPAFVANHPYPEVPILRRLDTHLPAGPSLAGTSPFLGRYLTHRYVGIPDAFGREIAEPRLYLDRLRRLLAASGAAYLVVGEIDLRDRPRSLLGPAPPALWLAPGLPPRAAAGSLGAGHRVAVWRILAGPDRPLKRTARP
jgi:4-amino-4-deoxy-L-arabinose transferase-like glycosyltransferase